MHLFFRKLAHSDGRWRSEAKPLAAQFLFIHLKGVIPSLASGLVILVASVDVVSCKPSVNYAVQKIEDVLFTITNKIDQKESSITR